MLRVVIIEDEKNALEVLKKMLYLLKKPVNIVAEFGTVREGVEFLNRSDIDLLFLDVELQDGDSFQLLDQLNQRNFQVIFTTAFDNYAIKAIKSEAVDYIVKPIDPEELSLAFDRAMQIVKERAILTNYKSDKPEVCYINIRRVEGIVRVFKSDIITLKSEGSYTIISTGREEILASKNIKYFEQKLGGEMFIRTHQSYVVNVNYIKSYSSEGELILNSGEVIPVSTRKRSYIRSIVSSLISSV